VVTVGGLPSSQRERADGDRIVGGLACEPGGDEPHTTAAPTVEEHATATCAKYGEFAELWSFRVLARGRLALILAGTLLRIR
jgi:hypothetical protein